MKSGLRQLVLKAGWAPASVVVLHAGIAGLSGHKQSFDPAMHFLGGAAIAHFLWHATAIWKGWFGEPMPLARSLVVFCITTTVAVFWEFAESLSGALIGAYSQLSLKETMGDLFMGCIGAGSYLIINRMWNQIRGNRDSARRRAWR